jgi:NAD(P)H-hydrate epimerase
MKLVSVAQMQEIEREAVEAGLSYDQMMENAGSNLAAVIAGELADLEFKNILGLVGSGNNGGDTLVALSILSQLGWTSTAYLVKARPKDDPLVDRFQSSGGILYLASDDLKDAQFPHLTELVQTCSVLLDGVLGTGTKLPLKKEIADVLGAVGNTLDDLEELPVVIAVDCPSGVDNDTGETSPQTIIADLTVTMAAVKQGLLKFPASVYAGELTVVGIGLEKLPAPLGAWDSLSRLVVDEEMVAEALPYRANDAHKGTFGTALIVAGSLNYTGAVVLAGEAAYRSGAGLVTLAVPSPLHLALAGTFPEATWLLLPHEMGVVSENAANIVRDNLSRATAMLVGPGFGIEETTRSFLQKLLITGTPHRKGSIGFVSSQSKTADKELEKVELPRLVIDADGLKLLAKIEDWPKKLPERTVLTPHPGEMAVLTGLDKDEIQADRIAVAEKYAKEWGHIVVLKGAFTVIAEPGGSTAVVPIASAALARAGTGDVLAGLIVGLRAQGVEAFSAALSAAWIHAEAGLQAAEDLGSTASVLAGDVLGAVPEVMSRVS